MKILKNTKDLNLMLNVETDFLQNLGSEENLQQFEGEVLSDIINPIENYENIRYIHKPYTGITSNTGDTQCDIWFYFYFLSGGTYVQDYTPQGISSIENELMLKQSTESFFRLEFYKTPGVVTNNVLRCQPPTRVNRKLAFSRNLSLPLGEKMFYNTLNGYVHVPVFNGNNYRNKENMYLYWFEDESVLQETNLSGSTTGNTFFMTAKFYNAKEGTIIDFTNNRFNNTHNTSEELDMYYQVDIDKVNHTYEIYRYTTGTTGNIIHTIRNIRRIGDVSGTTINAVKFYESGGYVPTTPTPTPTSGNLTPVSATPTLTPTPTKTPTPTPTTSSNPLGVTSILLSSGTTVANACTGSTQVYFYQTPNPPTIPNFSYQGKQIYVDSSLITPAPGRNNQTVYYYSADYNTVYYINDSEGRKYDSNTLCPTPTPTTGSVINAVVSLVDGQTACDGGDYGVAPSFDPVLDPKFFTLTIYGSNIVNASAIINIDTFLLADFTTNQEFYVRGRSSGKIYWKKFILDGDPSSGVKTATASGEANLCL